MEKCYLNIPFEVKSEDIKEDGSFRGYGSLFDKTPDAHQDIVSAGAFTETLAHGGRNRTGVAMLWQHQSGQIPGVWSSLSEDKRGLDARGKLALKTQLGNDVYEIMRLGAELGTFQLGLSIGYDAVKYEMDEKKKVRNLKKVELWELSIVTFPAKLGAVVSNLKEAIESEHEIETTLLRAGISKDNALYIAKLCRPSLQETGTAGAFELSAAMDSLKGFYAELYQKAVEDHKDLVAMVEKMGSHSAEAIESLWKTAEATKRKLEKAEEADMAAKVDEYFTRAAGVLVDNRLALMEDGLRSREMSVEPEPEEEAYSPAYDLDRYDTQRRKQPDPFEYYNVKITPGTGGGRLANCIALSPPGTQ